MSELRTIVYTSTANSWVDELALKHTLHTSRAFNLQKNIGGVLLYEDGTFLQCIEGSSTALDEVFERIAISKLHYDIEVILDAPIKKRAFPNWVMGFVEMPKDADLRVAANQWKVYEVYIESKNIHAGAQIIANFWERRQASR